jgi:hypothetical protein
MVAIEFLRSEYGDDERIWSHTPKQTAAYVGLAQHRRRRERAQFAYTVALATRGDPRELNERIGEWSEPPAANWTGAEIRRGEGNKVTGFAGCSSI